MRTYKFTAQCRSGEWKTFEFEAESYKAARIRLSELIEAN